MRTPAVHKGSSTVGTFEKIEPNFTFWKTAKSHATILLKSVPNVRGIYQAICVKKKWSLGSAPRQRPIRAEKRWRKQAEACRPLTGANPAQAVVFASQGDMVVVLRELFTTLLMRNRGENNNCAVACMRTVEVLKRLIGTMRRWRGRGEPRDKKLADVTS